MTSEPAAASPPGPDAVGAAGPTTGSRLLLLVDLAATFVFAVEGGLRAAEAHLDILGVLVLAFATALGGGIIRDLLMGSSPPRSLRSARYALTAFAGGLVVFVLHAVVKDMPSGVLTALDAGGLALFAVSGAALALAAGVHPMTAVFLGTITGVGGGTIRDVLLNEVPAVLRVEVYAVAALLGATITVIGIRSGLPRWMAMTVGAVACFTLRVVAAAQGWNLPTT